MSEERSENNLNINVIKQAYILNTVTPVLDNDIETGDSERVLKGILKKSHDLQDEERTGLIVIKMCTTLLMIIITTPIIVCDLYFQ